MSAAPDTLLLDLGNTHLHWRLGPRQGILRDPESSNEWPFRPAEIGRVVWAAVGDDQRLEGLRRLLDKVEWTRCRHPDPEWLPTRYDSAQLGIDRWLAMLGVVCGSFALPGPCIVVDAGTAVTLDILTHDGHIGGWIMPGYHRWHAGLYAGTRIPPAPPGVAAARPGEDTVAAMANGWQVAMESVIAAQLTERAGATLFLTGGDAGRLATRFAGAFVVPELTLDGLAAWSARN